MQKKKIETFEDLRVWQKGIELVKQVYLITKEGDLSKNFGLRDQLQRASVSISTNIAEGSAGEVRSLLRVAVEIGYLNKSLH